MHTYLHTCLHTYTYTHMHTFILAENLTRPNRTRKGLVVFQVVGVSNVLPPVLRFTANGSYQHYVGTADSRSIPRMVNGLSNTACKSRVRPPPPPGNPLVSNRNAIHNDAIIDLRLGAYGALLSDHRDFEGPLSP